MAENYKVDNVDLKILEILMQDAKKPYTEVAKKSFCIWRNGPRTDEQAGRGRDRRKDYPESQLR